MSPDVAGHAEKGRWPHGDLFGRDAAEILQVPARGGGEHPQHLTAPSRLRAARRTHRAGVDLHLLRGGKLFGWFNGPGIHETSIYFSRSAHLHPGGLFAVLGGIIEFFGAIAVGLGLFTRLAGIALFGDMVMAMITITWATGIDSHTAPPGYQLNLALVGLAVVVAFLGSGRFSLDAEVERLLLGHNGRAVRARPDRADDRDNGVGRHRPLGRS